MSPRRLWIALTLLVAGCDRPARENAALPAAPAAPAAPAVVSSAASIVRPARAPRKQRAPSIAALDHKVYIRQNPRAQSPEIGVVGLGTAVRLAAQTPASTSGCERGWYPVEPKGYVCLDASTTLDLDHPLLRAKRGRTGDYSRGSPFDWGESREAPSYRRLPTEAEQRRFEPGLERHLERSADLEPSRRHAPAFLDNHAPSPWFSVHPAPNSRARHELVPTRSTVAWTDEFFADGRSWVLTTELLVVPKDKLVPQVPSTFRGVELNWWNARLPMAFVRGADWPKFRRVDDAPEAAVIPAQFTDAPPEQGRFAETGKSWPRLARVELTGRERRQRGASYLETRDTGLWIREADATVVQSRPPEGFELAAGEKWIDVSIFRGTLVAYEGEKPVFATLISPGLKGYARQDGKPTKNTTPTGTFRIEWKHLSTTMSPNPETMSYYLSEVPYTQFFHMPFALHAAYWHDRFGEPKSGGCVNLSPDDARWLFHWTTPAVPEGWHAVRSGEDFGQGTWVRVR